MGNSAEFFTAMSRLHQPLYLYKGLCIWKISLAAWAVGFTPAEPPSSVPGSVLLMPSFSVMPGATPGDLETVPPAREEEPRIPDPSCPGEEEGWSPHPSSSLAVAQPLGSLLPCKPRAATGTG